LPSFEEWQAKRDMERKCQYCGVQHTDDTPLKRGDMPGTSRCADRKACEARIVENFRTKAGGDNHVARTYRCKQCKQGGFTSPHAVHQHYLDDHPKDTPDDDTEEPTEGVEDAELSLITICTQAFLTAGTDAASDFRVLEYLAQRFGPMAYDDTGGETDETTTTAQA